MLLRRLLNLLLGGRGKGGLPTGKTSRGIQVSVTATDASGEYESRRDYLVRLEQSRQDRAAIERRADPDAYNPIPELSTTPECPYCKCSLGDRKPPSRRSRFSCQHCGNVVHVDPHHRIFPSCYLNAKQELIARYLSILDNSPGMAGRSGDFWWAAQQKEWLKGKAPLSDQEAADALWTLMNYCVTAMPELLPPEELENVRHYADELQRHMKAYRSEEKEVNEIVKAARNAAKTSGSPQKSKIDLVCPSCFKHLGTVPQPSRRSTRKCKKCSNAIYVDPKQRLFDSPFLSERQAYLADTVRQLDQWVFTDGSMEAFNSVKRKLGKTSPLSDADVTEVVRSLIVHNLDKACESERRDIVERKQLLGDAFEEHEGHTLCSDSIREMLNDFDKEFS